MQKKYNYKRINIIQIIKQDLFNIKTEIFLFLLNIFFAIATVFITHNTKLLVKKLEEISYESNLLENRWYELILEKKALENYDRLKVFAKQELKMKEINKVYLIN